MNTVLYNGIRLPEEWPPRDMNPSSREPMPVPYLDSPPSVIPIDVGRQLFVDGFLIENTTLKRVFHPAQKYEENPILVPVTAAEQERPAATACPFDDGVAYDPVTRKFLLWYLASYPGHTAVAFSDDGLHWERPDLDILAGTNVILPNDYPMRSRDSFCPFLDLHAQDPTERFKAYLYVFHGKVPWEVSEIHQKFFPWENQKGKRTSENWLLKSGDGVHWEHAAQFTARGADGTTLHYNPFRRKWVLNLKRDYEGKRGRAYIERDQFWQFQSLREATPEEALSQVRSLDEPAPGLSEGQVFWVGADRLDLPDPEWVVQEPTQLYMLEVVPYESLILGIFAILYGPPNDICRKGQFPKLTQIKLGYSRDGFHWYRPDREVFIGATKKDGDWDRAYLRPAAGCIIARDRLHFYYSGFSGIAPSGARDIYAGGSTHVAWTRRDGFVSMDAGDAPGDLITRPLTFKGGHLFVNVEAPEGELQVEALDREGRVIEPYSMERCIPVHGDETCVPIRWRGAADLSAAGGGPARFRFRLTNGSLYAFWVALDPGGKSHGYVASGGPGFSGPRDV